MPGPQVLTDIKQILKEKGAKTKCKYCSREYITFRLECYYEKICFSKFCRRQENNKFCTCCEYDTYFIVQWEEEYEKTE